MGFDGSLNITDADGYTYVLSYAAKSDGGFRADPTNAKPGRTDLVVAASAKATVTNTTPGRSAPGKNIRFDVWGLYPQASPVCKTEQTPSHDMRGGQRTFVGPAGDPRYCAVLLSPSLSNMDTTIPAGNRRDLVETGALGFKQTIPGVPESEAPAIIAALDRPASFVTFLTDGGNPNSKSDVVSPLKIPGSCTVQVSGNNGSSPTSITAVPLSGGPAPCGG
ncbi:hypothetical protein [Embleya sp. NPDC001921]